LCFTLIVWEHVTIISKHCKFQFNHFDLQLKVSNGLLMATAQEMCIIQINRRDQVLVETRLDMRMEITPLIA
jgi:hypothetical protein